MWCVEDTDFIFATKFGFGFFFFSQSETFGSVSIVKNVDFVIVTSMVKDESGSELIELFQFIESGFWFQKASAIQQKLSIIGSFCLSDIEIRVKKEAIVDFPRY